MMAPKHVKENTSARSFDLHVRVGDRKMKGTEVIFLFGLGFVNMVCNDEGDGRDLP